MEFEEDAGFPEAAGSGSCAAETVERIVRDTVSNTTLNSRRRGKIRSIVLRTPGKSISLLAQKTPQLAEHENDSRERGCDVLHRRVDRLQRIQA